tara:strand:- start:2503 stop:3198 length:696 start_codon:yes stop_codon:yes gene_type:complete
MKIFLNVLKLIFSCCLLCFLLSFTFNDKIKIERKVNLIELEKSSEKFVSKRQIIQITENFKNDLNISLIEKNIKEIPQIKDAIVYLNHNGDIDIKLEEKTPILRIFNENSSFYLDSDCDLLPISKSYTARKLIVTGDLDYYSKDEICDLYSVIESKEFYNSLITQIDIKKNNTRLVTRIKDLEINIGDLSEIEKKFEKLTTFYERVVKYKGWNYYEKVNLKFNDQIICSRR